MNDTFDEGNLRFDFSACGVAERFDMEKANPYGLKAVDFIVNTDHCVYFVEVKDYQNPNASAKRRKKDYEMLISAVTDKKSAFCIEMGVKIKDSLLRQYALGKSFTKKVVYLLFINLDKLGESERGLLKLKSKINGHVPTGLNDDMFGAFTGISFDLVNAKQLKTHGISCAVCSSRSAISE